MNIKAFCEVTLFINAGLDKNKFNEGDRERQTHTFRKF